MNYKRILSSSYNPFKKSKKKFRFLRKKPIRKLNLNLFKIGISINKRQKFVIGVLFLSLGLFFSQHLLGKSGVFVLFFFSLLTDLFLFWSIYQDLKESFSWHIFILPFLYSLSFGLFYFLVPARFLTRIAITSLYGVGLYSLFLSQNIFIVASVRTIALLSSARIVSFVLSVISFFFLSNIIFTLDLAAIPTAFLVFVFSSLLVFHSLWTYSLDKSVNQILWGLSLALCLLEVSIVLWFWPTSPTVVALFLTGFFYTIVGLSHVWFGKRLFRNVLWEYLWVAVIVLFVLILFTSWT